MGLNVEDKIIVSVNGEQRSIPDGTTVQYLVQAVLGVEGPAAVELNLAILKKEEWDIRRLREGDRIEVVHFVGGG